MLGKYIKLIYIWWLKFLDKILVYNIIENLCVICIDKYNMTIYVEIVFVCVSFTKKRNFTIKTNTEFCLFHFIRPQLVFQSTIHTNSYSHPNTMRTQCLQTTRKWCCPTTHSTQPMKDLLHHDVHQVRALSSTKADMVNYIHFTHRIISPNRTQYICK